MEWSNIIVLSSSFFVLLFIGVPISFSIGIASLLTIMLSIPLMLLLLLFRKNGIWIR